MKKFFKIVLSVILFSTLFTANTNLAFAEEDEVRERTEVFLKGILDDVFDDGKVYLNNEDITDDFKKRYLSLYNNAEYDLIVKDLADYDYTYVFDFEEETEDLKAREGGSTQVTKYQKVAVKTKIGYVHCQNKWIFLVSNTTSQITSIKYYFTLVENATSAADSNIYYYIKSIVYSSEDSSSPNLHINVIGSLKVKYNGADYYPSENVISSGSGLIYLSQIVMSYGTASSYSKPSYDNSWRSF